MKLSKKVNLIIYRFKEQGLEVFLVDQHDTDQWSIPSEQTNIDSPKELVEDEKLIELEPVQQEDGKAEEAWAVEGEWHDIPSLKNMLYEDAVFLKDKLKGFEKGTFLTLKEAFRKVLPHQYKFLKELKEILTDRNSLKNM